MSSFVKGGGGGSEKVTIDGVKVKAKLELTSYSGENPYTMGQDGMTFDANTLLKEGLQIINGVNGEGQYVWKKSKLEQVTITNPSVVMNSGSGKIKVTTTDDIDLSLVDLFFFDGFVSSEPYKFYTQNGQLYFYSTSYPVTAYNTETHELTSNAGISNTTFTYTGTKEITKHVFEDYVVADDEGSYPDGGESDGYWYELIEEGITGIDCGEITVTSFQYLYETTINHNLGVAPKYFILFPKRLNRKQSGDRVTMYVSSGDGTDILTSANAYEAVWQTLNYTNFGGSCASSGHTGTATTVKLTGSVALIEGGTYGWIAIA